MATSTFNAAEIELRRKLLLEQLAELQDEKLKSIGGLQIIDFHHPERSPGWPIYRHQAFPQLLYHATEKDPRNEERRLGVRRRNEANPTLAPMDIPDSEPLTVKVANEAEKREKMGLGFVEQAPARQMIDGNSPLEAIGRAAHNPLTAASPEFTANTQAPVLSVEMILKLNSMPKDELVKHVLEVYGVEAPDEASKVEIITAVQNASR